MGEHGTWFDYLNRFSWWQDFQHWAHGAWGRKWQALMFTENGFTLTHVLITLLVVLVTIAGGLAFYRGTKSKDQGVVPPRTMNFRNFFEYLTESVYGMTEGAMGEQHAKKFFPLIGALFIFILFNNLFALIPGFSAPTDTLKTNVGIAVLVFLLTHYYGIKEHGIHSWKSFIIFSAIAIAIAGFATFKLVNHQMGALPAVGLYVLALYFLAFGVPYLHHFHGPSLGLSPLIFPIELISHFARPMSLSVRLMGNMMADHKVVMSFFALVPILVPVPFLLLGLLVCFVQALVFCTLAMVYLGMAMEHEEH